MVASTRDVEEVQPNPQGILDALSRVGYSIEVAVADLVDNSIDAKAKKIVIRLWLRDGHITGLSVADDGVGMSNADMSEAMRFGARGTGRDAEEFRLGKFGLGLKSASFSQCTELTVTSRQEGAVAGRQWTSQRIAEGWLLEVLNDGEARRGLARFGKDFGRRGASTIVDWRGMHSFVGAGLDPEGELQRVVTALSGHLGLVFHRFLDGAKGRATRIVIDTRDDSAGTQGVPRTVDPLDPFRYVASGAAGYPRDIAIPLGGLGQVAMRAHIWPPRVRPAEYTLTRGSAAHQGLYFYRNDRLLQAGGWNGLRGDAEPHMSLARAAIDLPADLDEPFRVNVQKSNIQVPPAFVEALARGGTATDEFREYLSEADTTYRSASAATRAASAASGRIVPGPGIGRTLQRAAKRSVAGAKCAEDIVRASFIWERLPRDVFFDIRRGDDPVIVLNARYRSAVLHGGKGSAADAPLVKMLLFVMLREDLVRRKVSKSRRDALASMQELLVGAAMSQGGA
jgi:hypothetical protein